jgi:hypothetical protein
VGVDGAMERSSCRSCVISLMILAALIVVPTPSARAKGPESVTLTGPGIDRPIALDTTHSGLLGRAMEQTGLWWSVRSDRPLPIRESPRKLGPGYTLTWILSDEPPDREEERAIRQVIYPFAEGGVTIHTPTQDDLRGLPEATGWFRAPALGDTLAALGVPVSSASPPLAPGSLVFTRERPEGGCDLFAIEPDGTGPRAMTDTPSTCEALPTVAAGGSTVAVSLELDNIALIDLATSVRRRLTDDPITLDNHPAWSPDGSRIAFARGPEMGPGHIYVMEADGTDVRQLTQGSGSDRNPAWSLDGARIAFARSGNLGFEVYVMDADGSNITAVTSLSAESAPSPSWSPDGSRIALDVNGAIHVVSVDGTGLQRLSQELPKGVLDMSPSWSPDGTQIAFMRYTNDDVADAAEDGDIWIVDADGTDATRITRGPAIDAWPAWVSGSAE